MARLPVRSDALVPLKSAQHHDKRGIEVLQQMYAYFSFGDLPVIEPDESTDYIRAA